MSKITFYLIMFPLIIKFRPFLNVHMISSNEFFAQNNFNEIDS